MVVQLLLPPKRLQACFESNCLGSKPAAQKNHVKYEKNHQEFFVCFSVPSHA